MSGLVCFTETVSLNEKTVAAEVDGFGLPELVERSGVPVRTIRWYQSEGLLPKPTKRGRDAVYTDDHRQRLELIAELRDRGLTLTAIRDLVSRDRPGRTVAE